MLKGVIINYRRGRHTVNPRQYIIEIEGIDNRSKASRLIGKKVIWQGKNYPIIGKILAPHGNKGCVRARFRRGLPGDALGTEVLIVDESAKGRED